MATISKMETVQTAVEFFAEKLNEFNGKDNPWFDIPLSLLEQAKQMEKEQIMKAFSVGDNCGYSFAITEDSQQFNSAEQYYNKTYNK